jgi:hypothetical protein
MIYTSFSFADFQINTHTTNNQANPAIAADANGNFVVVWSSYLQDGSSNGIFGRRFNAACQPTTGEFQINSTTAGNQTEPAIAMNPAGNFIVAWHGPGPSEEDIFARRFDLNCLPAGPEFRVNTYTFSKQRCPKVAMNTAGDFVVVWESEKLGAEPYAWTICGQLFYANSTPDGNEFEANLLLQCHYPDVAMDAAGNFTVVWMQDDSRPYNVIMARRYDPDGSPKADPCQVNTVGFVYTAYPSVAMDDTGHFVVAWDGDPASASQDDIHARRYKFDGTPLTAQFTVNTITAGAQKNPKAAMNNSREFIIVWNSESAPGSNIRDIFAQRYDSFSNPVGDEFRINTYTVDDQKYPAVIMDDSAAFITAWQSNEQDGSGFGIFGQIGPIIGSADLTGDGFINFADYRFLAAEWLKQSNPLAADLVDDNKIDYKDLFAFCDQWLTCCYDCTQADLHSDNQIDFKDYVIFANNWLKQGPKLAGDTTGNGTVDFLDLIAITSHWTQTCQ